MRRKLFIFKRLVRSRWAKRQSQHANLLRLRWKLSLSCPDAIDEISLSLKKKKKLSPEDAHVRNAHWLIACLARKGSIAILQIHTHTNTHGAEKALHFAHTNAQTHAWNWQQIITAVSQTLTPGSTWGRRRNFLPNSIQAIKLSRSNFVDFLRREGGKKKWNVSRRAGCCDKTVLNPMLCR